MLQLARHLPQLLLIGFLSISCSGYDWQRIARLDSAEDAIKFGQWERQQQQALSVQLVGKDKTAVHSMWGKPDYITSNPLYPRYYVGYYENADPKVLKEIDEEWTYIFPRKRIPFVSDRIPVHLYFKDGRVVFVGL